MTAPHVAIAGGGMGGLAAALDLARRGLRVTLCERAEAPGGKARAVPAAGRPVEAGPTVLTMRWVFEALFRDAGAELGERLRLARLPMIARHGWPDGGRLDLYDDPARSEAAIAEFAGPAEAARFRAFSERAGRIYRALAPAFIESQKPSPAAVARAIGPRLGLLRDLGPAQTLAGALSRSFRDPRLVQLFGRYATYVGGSPYLSPALLMLIWHVEEAGVWQVEGGISGLARAIAALAEARGAEIRLAAPVAEIAVEGGRATGLVLESGERVAADAVVFAGDAGALGAGLLGPAARAAVEPVPPEARALSALTLTGLARAGDAPLAHHTVAFSADYRAEFDQILRARRLPSEPTTYVCAQDRGAEDAPPPEGAERVLLIVNAPPDGDIRPHPQEEIDRCLDAALSQLARCGFPLEIDRETATLAPPQAWAARFPGSGGALYGRAPHGSLNGAWASFRRPGARSRVRGLYLAGGSVHPGAGVPMATLSGRLAAAAVLADLGAPRARASTSPSRPAAMPGGI